jgi:hypothetical protein
LPTGLPSHQYRIGFKYLIGAKAFSCGHFKYFTTTFKCRIGYYRINTVFEALNISLGSESITTSTVIIQNKWLDNDQISSYDLCRFEPNHITQTGKAMKE